MGTITERDATGALITQTAGNVYAVENASDTVVGNIVDGVMCLFSGDPISTDELRYSSAVLHVANTALTSTYTRRRVDAGHDPMLKVFF